MKRRSESFFGLHFDFHASPERSAAPIGATLKEEDIREICRSLKPDFIQIDCKGHPGWASYPTELGNAMPAFALDPLELWRRVTREEGVALYMHYSGIVDRKYLAEHPEDGVFHPDGNRDTGSTRPRSPYADRLMIPQLKELALRYGADGAWVDGECWGSGPDYDPETVAAFEKETGVDLNGELPVEREHPHFEAYREFCREQFRAYVRHYVTAVHEAAPAFQIASNWAYSNYMPEPVTASVDFISGDLTPEDSFCSARYSGRIIAGQGYPWDLMAWNFRRGPGGAVKHPVQILQEAAAVIALGGGFQNYIPQYPDGSPRMSSVRPMKALAEFMRARQPYCFRGKPVHQIGLLLSTRDRHLESESLFSLNGEEKIKGLCNLFCDAGHSVEIGEEHVFLREGYGYPVIAVPEAFEGPAPETVRDLLAYAEKGGSLLLTGLTTARLFASAGVPFRVEEEPLRRAALTRDGLTFAGAARVGILSFPRGETLWTAAPDDRSEGRPAAAVIPFGKGKIGVTAFDIGSAYHAASQYLHRSLIRDMLDRLYAPLVKVEKAAGLLETVALRKDGKLMIQLVNGNGGHRADRIATEDYIPPCLEAILTLRLPERPKALRLEPAGTDLSFTWEKGVARVSVPRVDLHEVIVAEE